MIKNLIAPVQAWLLSQHRCVACGSDLDSFKKREVKEKNLVTCSCGRIFVYDKAKDSYRRALFEEV
jgi:predicted  nucleic acid-binding Zn-ribbon protein